MQKVSSRIGSFDEEYYERGLESGRSCYQNYRWIPELTIPLAMSIIDYLGIRRGERVLDFGCAKGYLVRAFRLLYRDAWGVDVSRYAIDNADPAVIPYCVLSDGPGELALGTFDYCVAKDVFEHIPTDALVCALTKIPAKKMFAVVPLGENNKYNAPINDLDKTHIICEKEGWWIDLFHDGGWMLVNLTYRIPGVKDSYKDIDRAHGFFTLEKIWIGSA